MASEQGDRSALRERDAIIELCAREAHDQWMQSKRSAGITKRAAEDGTEQMVPYEQLPEHLKELTAPLCVEWSGRSSSTAYSMPDPRSLTAIRERGDRLLELFDPPEAA